VEDTPGLLCAELGIEEFAWLSQSCEPVELRAGETPIAAGDLADHFYILLGGELRATPRSGEPCRFLRRPDEPPLLIGAIFLKNLEAAADCRLLRVRDDGNIWIRAMIEGDGLAVEIADDGPGIPEQIQSRIFEPFFTTKDTGHSAGLGLDIVNSIVVRRHSGSIQVSSMPADTRFRVLLPLIPASHGELDDMKPVRIERDSA